MIWETPKLPEGVFPPASTEPAPKNRLPLPSPSTAVLSGWSRLPAPVASRALPRPHLTEIPSWPHLLRALLTPHFQDKTHTPHTNPLTPPPHPPLPPRPNPNSTALHSRPFTSWWWEVDPYFFENQKNRVPRSVGKNVHSLVLTWAAGGASTKHLQPLGLQEHLFQQVNCVLGLPGV